MTDHVAMMLAAQRLGGALRLFLERFDSNVSDWMRGGSVTDGAVEGREVLPSGRSVVRAPPTVARLFALCCAPDGARLCSPNEHSRYFRRVCA